MLRELVGVSAGNGYIGGIIWFSGVHAMGQQLPLFPLNSVLFPGMPLSLRIFEERYKLMIGECLRTREPFGVVLIQSGSEVQGLGVEAVPYNVGCTAQIVQTLPLGNGQMNILTVGQERFRITSLHRDRPYLVGEVEMHPFVEGDTARVAVLGRLLRPWVEQYLDLLGKVENVQFDFSQLPQEPFPLACLSASLLKIGLPEKQELLSTPDMIEFMKKTRVLYRKEVTLLSSIIAQDVKQQVGPFSLN
jgi:Lon protease-like protein